MTIKVGDRLPEATFTTPGPEGPQQVTTDQVFKGKKVVLFAVPGAFTPTCSARHLPGFRDKAAEFKAKGVDTIACLAVNDAFVMGAWAKDQGAGEHVLMLADGNGDFTRKLGLEMDGQQVRHGPALAALRHAGRGRRGEGAAGRAGGRVPRLLGRAHAGARLSAPVSAWPVPRA